jgi:hypothetical protein
MAKVCPKCSADTDALDEEVDDEGLCIHEKAMIAGVAIVSVAGIFFGTGAV